MEHLLPSRYIFPMRQLFSLSERSTVCGIQLQGIPCMDFIPLLCIVCKTTAPGPLAYGVTVHIESCALSALVS